MSENQSRSTRSTRSAAVASGSNTTTRSRWNRVRAMDEDSSDEEQSIPKTKGPDFKHPGTPPSGKRSGPKANCNEIKETGNRSQNQAGQSSAVRGSQQKNREAKNSKKENDKDNFSLFDLLVSGQLSEEHMVKEVMFYMSFTQGKNPTRKCDIIRLAMNRQSKSFKKVIKKVAKELLRIFGLRLIGIRNGPNDIPIACGLLEASSFITVNKYRQRITALAAPDQSFSSDLVKASLLLILTCSYMTDRFLDEDYIWEILEKVELTEPLCKRKDDFRKFLKTEYVDLLYLVKLETKDEDKHTIRYGWGVRAEQEFNKYSILKFVSKTFRKDTPAEFASHYSKIPAEVIEAIDKEDEIMNIRGPVDSSNAESSNNTSHNE